MSVFVDLAPVKLCFAPPKRAHKRHALFAEQLELFIDIALRFAAVLLLASVLLLSRATSHITTFVPRLAVDKMVSNIYWLAPHTPVDLVDDYQLFPWTEADLSENAASLPGGCCLRCAKRVAKVGLTCHKDKDPEQPCVSCHKVHTRCELVSMRGNRGCQFADCRASCPQLSKVVPARSRCCELHIPMHSPTLVFSVSPTFKSMSLLSSLAFSFLSRIAHFMPS